ncbi:hypothetical protein NU219Hw_g1993t1 [Hortaea werneckii]
MERHDSGVEHKDAAPCGHYKNWPNAAGFNATEIAGDTRHPIRLGLKGHIPAYAAGVLFDGFTTTHRFELTAVRDGVCDEIWYSSRCQVDELLEQARNEGETFNYNLAFGRIPAYRVFRMRPDGTTDILAEISGNGVKPAYLHSLALTPNFVILCVWPAFFKSKGIDILWHRNLLDAMEFDPRARTKWYVVDRHHNRGVVKTFESPSFFCFHTTNAWEERADDCGNVDLTCELVEFPNMDILHRFYCTNLVSDQPPIEATHKRHPHVKCSLVRYKLEGIPLQASAKRTKFSATGKKTMAISAGDLPQFNQQSVFKPHRFVYSVLDRGESSFNDGLAKTDTATGEIVVWEALRHTPGEPVFISKPESQGEDEGVILSVVLDGNRGQSYLLCLDARSFTEIGRAEVGTPVGFGFHGTHFPTKVGEARP